MKIVRTIDEVRTAVACAKAEGKSVGFVPTMGNLHKGHYSLMKRAVGKCDYVVVSIFVNPTQFGPDEDFTAYPRTEDADIKGSEQSGVSLVFIPPVDEIYRGSPGAGGTIVRAGELAAALCGESRPGHFDGVCTVVSILFNIVSPDIAFFGEKDYQQVLVIRRMVNDLKINVSIEMCPTIREQDGLAFSSRNSYLSSEQRAQAASLFASLCEAKKIIEAEKPLAENVIDLIQDNLVSFAPDGEIDYVKVVDPDTLLDVETTDFPVLIALAVRFGKARLIDHVIAG